MEKEREPSSLGVRIVCSPEAVELEQVIRTVLNEIGEMTPEEITVVEDEVSPRSCSLAIGVEPAEIPALLEKGKVILFTMPDGDKKGLEIYLETCKRYAGSEWKNVIVANVGSQTKEDVSSGEIDIRHWWPLVLAFFAV